MRKSTGAVAGDLKWRSIKIGGQGFAVKSADAADGSWTLVITDVSGIYRRDSGQEKWDLITSAAYMTVPPDLTLSNGTGLTPYASGGYDGTISPADANYAYIMFRGRMMRSTNKGLAFAIETSFNGNAAIYMNPNEGGNHRFTANKIKGDPSNRDVAYCGSQKNGAFRRLSTGWAAMAGLPVPTYATFGDTESTYIFAIDAASSLTAAGADQRRSVVYCSVAGNGIYKTTDGGTTWALLANTPTVGGTYKAYHMVCYGGVLWVAVQAAGQNLYKSTDNGANFTQITMPTGGGIQCYEVDPKNTARHVAVASKPIESLNSGSTWSSIYQGANQKAVATSSPTGPANLERGFRAGLAGQGIIRPHPTLQRDWEMDGWGMYYYPTPYAAWGPLALRLIEDTKGLEQLCATHADILPDGTTFMAAQDRGIFMQNPDRSKQCAVNFDGGQTLTYGQNVAQALDDPNYLVARLSRDSDTSGFSANKGLTWSNFAAQIPGYTQGGSIAISNKAQIVAFPGVNVWPRYSANQGASWSDITFTGMTRVADGSENGWGWGPFYVRRFIVCRDPTTAGVFYAYNSGSSGQANTAGIWKSTNGGSTFARISAGPTLLGGQDPGFNASLTCAPNGDLYFCTGQAGSDNATENANTPGFRSTDGGVTWAQLGEVNEPHYIAIGADKPGGTAGYTLWTYGFKVGVPGLYYSLNKGVNWLLAANCPHYDFNACLAGDLSEFGRVVMGMQGTGFWESYYSCPLTLS